MSHSATVGLERDINWIVTSRLGQHVLTARRSRHRQPDQTRTAGLIECKRTSDSLVAATSILLVSKLLDCAMSLEQVSRYVSCPYKRCSRDQWCRGHTRLLSARSSPPYRGRRGAATSLIGSTRIGRSAAAHDQRQQLGAQLGEDWITPRPHLIAWTVRGTAMSRCTVQGDGESALTRSLTYTDSSIP